MSCYLASAFVIANLMWLVPMPQMCSGMSDYDECMHMADVGCTMVEECSEGSEIEETFEQCYERASQKCEKYK